MSDLNNILILTTAVTSFNFKFKLIIKNNNNNVNIKLHMTWLIKCMCIRIIFMDECFNGEERRKHKNKLKRSWIY